MSAQTTSALELANTIRVRRAAERERIFGMSRSDGIVRLVALLDSPPDWLASEPLGRFLTWPARTGRNTTTKTLAMTSAMVGRYVSAEARVDELDDDEKRVLVDVLSGAKVRPLVHVCSSCGVEQRYSEFALNGTQGGGWRDHRGKSRRSYCRLCQSNRDVLRRYPERYARERRAVLGPDRTLPVEPFAAWLEQRRTRFLRAEYRSAEDFAEMVGISARQVECYIHRERAAVKLSIVDRALTRDGTTNLWEIYPDLYPDEEVAA